LHIRLEAPPDREAVRAVHVESFPTTLEANLVDALRSAGRLSASLVALVDGILVGHVAYSPVIAAGDRSGAGLGPVAVLPSFRRRGIADQLIRAGLDLCREQHVDYVVVLGEPSYYSRFGFVPASHYGLSDEFGGGDAFQALELRPGGMPYGGGLVRYAQEFSDAVSDTE
jgi:putative acetyltransferase